MFPNLSDAKIHEKIFDGLRFVRYLLMDDILKTKINQNEKTVQTINRYCQV